MLVFIFSLNSDPREPSPLFFCYDKGTMCGNAAPRNSTEYFETESPALRRDHMPSAGLQTGLQGPPCAKQTKKQTDRKQNVLLTIILSDTPTSWFHLIQTVSTRSPGPGLCQEHAACSLGEELNTAALRPFKFLPSVCVCLFLMM